MTVFGRDTIITNLQTMLLGPELAVSALETLAELQSTVDDPAIDAEPGKIVHELPSGRAAEKWFARYYGTWMPRRCTSSSCPRSGAGRATTTSRCAFGTGTAALEWIDRFGDRDGDGFVEYERALERARKPVVEGLRGLAAVPRRAACRGAHRARRGAGLRLRRKAQARRARRVAWGDEPLAARLDAEADELAARFDAAYWVPDRGGYYALALDRDKQRVNALCSNLGHLLWSGIVPQPRVEAIVDALMRHEVWSGWGMRTMSKSDAPYSPLSYHNGTVWPHDTAIAAWGLARYGQWEHVRRIAHALLEAAQHFGLVVAGGLCRLRSVGDSLPDPLPDRGAAPGMGAGTPILLLRLLLGLEPDVAQLRLASSPGRSLPRASPSHSRECEPTAAHGTSRRAMNV